MKISVIVRTHNEEKNLEKFILSYVNWVDHILVQDDESDDVQYLFDMKFKYPKVQLDFYKGKRIEVGNITRAYQHLQLNSMIEWAESIGTDWIIMDDCDCRPNYLLKEKGKEILHYPPITYKKFCVTRLYVYKDRGYIHDMSYKDNRWLPSLWAWRANQGFRFLDNGHAGQKFCVVDDEYIVDILPPYCLLHYPWQDDEMIETKRQRYTAIYGEEYKNFDPLRFGSLQKLPEWAKE